LCTYKYTQDDVAKILYAVRHIGKWKEELPSYDKLIEEWNSIYESMKMSKQQYIYVKGREEC